MKETIFSRNFVYVLRTKTARHMVSFMIFISISSKFSDLNFASYVLFICYCDTHSEPGLPVLSSLKFKFDHKEVHFAHISDIARLHNIMSKDSMSKYATYAGIVKASARVESANFLNL